MSAIQTILYGMLLLAAPLLFYALAALVYLSRRTPLHARIWIAVCLLTGSNWALILIVTRWLQPGDLALLATRMAFTCGAGACTSFLAFSLEFLSLRKQLRSLLWGSIAVASAFLLLVWTSPLIVEGISSYGYGLNYPVAGPLMPAYAIFVASQLLIPGVFFFRHRRKATGHVRLQLSYMSTAGVFLFVGGVGSLVPTMHRYSWAALVPSLLMMVAPSLVTYTIVRHQLWDIRTVAHRTALWLAASLASLIPVYLLIRYGTDLVANGQTDLALPGSLLLWGLFTLHFRVIQPWLDHRFARGRHDPARVVDEFGHEALNLRGMQELSQLIASTLRRTIYPQSARVHSFDPEDERLRPIDGSDGQGRSLPEQLRDWLVRVNAPIGVSQATSTEATAETQELLRQVCDSQTQVVVPLTDDKALIGLVELGEKQNLRAYTRDDYQLVERIRPPATVALANAQLYDRLHDLTGTLENRVQQRTEELEEANERLRALDRVKSKFFANITHELRTPLTLILAPLEDLLSERRGDPQLGADLETMYRNGLRLLFQINGLLDLAKRDAGELRLQVQQFPVAQLIEANVNDFRPICRRKGLAIDLVAPPEGLNVAGDRDKLDLVLTNLLANAVKFTPEGGQITVSATPEGDWLCLSVKDSGIGIPEDQLDQIFDRFAQVDSGTSRRYEGAGIGLSLVREIVDLHGGSVRAISKLDEGADFRLRLPCIDSMIADEVRDRRQAELPTQHNRRTEDHNPVFWTPHTLAGEANLLGGSSMNGLKAIAPPRKDNPRRLMLVEDNADLQSYLARRLSDLYTLTLCNNAQEALTKIAERRPELILADVMMPEISGYQLCSLIKENADTAHVPVILLTARQGVDPTLEGFKAGADDYVTKPFSLRELVARIEVQLKVVDATHSLAQQEKNAVLSLVATGLAHEVRNPVNAILNAARPLKERCAALNASETLTGASDLLTVILEAAQRIDLLVGDLLGVARDRPDESSYWNVGEAVESTLRLLRYKHGKEITVQTHIDHADPIFGKTAQLNQVLMNLVDNAMRAAGPQGAIVVTTSQQDEVFQLRVKDSGKGIPSGLEERIFDPLFSTHSSPDSTGLGLYISRRVIREHSGKIWAHAHCETGGAEFIVEIPLQGKD